MFCYACGNELTEQDFCTACGADVAYYKKIIYTSNRLYNEALDKARVRDLSGAVKCLRQSIRLNKENIDARNLLGLVYYETGEVVAALTEWVISKNLRDEKNLADYLLSRIQSEPQSLENLGSTAKKYNIALGYARQESYDLAIIQLKRILQLNPKFLRARELLALLYLRAEEYEKVKAECNRCLRIDAGDTTAKRYLRAATAASMPADGGKTRRPGKSDVQRYQSGNEVIIQPARSSAGGGIMSFGAAVLGVGVGIAIAWFLILPSRVSRVQQAARQEISSISEESDAKSAQIGSLEQELKNLNMELAELEASAEEADENGGLRSVQPLLRAVSAYLEDPSDMTAVAGHFSEIDTDAPEISENEDVRELLDSFAAAAGEALSEKYYSEGYSAFRDENDASAIENLKRAALLNPEKEEAVYYLGQAYYRSGDTDKARTEFEKVVNSFPDTNLAAEAQNALAEINNAGT